MAQPGKNCITLIVPYAPPNRTGGGQSALKFAAYLNEHGYTVSILSFNRNNEFDRISYVSGIKIKRIYYCNYNFITKLLSLNLILPSFIRSIRKTRTIIIYGSYIIGWEFMVLIARMLRKRVIFRSTLLGDDDAYSILKYNKALRLLRIIALKNISNYLALNPSFAQIFNLTIHQPHKLVLSPQGVDLKKFRPEGDENKANIRRNLNLPLDIPIILSVGILSKRKGYDEIFRVLKDIPRPFLYVVLGDYTLRNGHHTKKAQRNARVLFKKGKELLSDKIRYEGYVLNVEQYLQAADCVVMNSRKEGFPNALLEAMSCGKPIALRNSEYVHNYFLKHRINCLLYSNSEGLTHTIQQLLDDVKLREEIGSNARSCIQESYSYEHLIHKLGFNK